MPAVDQCEPQVVRALQKDGWRVVEKPFTIRLPERNILADLLIQRVVGLLT